MASEGCEFDPRGGLLPLFFLFSIFKVATRSCQLIFDALMSPAASFASPWMVQFPLVFPPSMFLENISWWIDNSSCGHLDLTHALLEQNSQRWLWWNSEIAGNWMVDTQKYQPCQHHPWYQAWKGCRWYGALENWRVYHHRQICYDDRV